MSEIWTQTHSKMPSADEGKDCSDLQVKECERFLTTTSNYLEVRGKERSFPRALREHGSPKTLVFKFCPPGW